MGTASVILNVYNTELKGYNCKWLCVRGMIVEYFLNITLFSFIINLLHMQDCSESFDINGDNMEVDNHAQ